MLFSDVLVDSNLKLQLINQVKNNRISHAQLFLGSEGTHKFALATAYAQYICCENRGEHDSCGVCPSCIKFSKLSHPDFHLIFPKADGSQVKKDANTKMVTNKFKEFILQNNYHLDYTQWNEYLEGKNKQLYINVNDCSYIIRQNSIRSYESGYKIFILWMVERLWHSAAPKLLKTLEEPENKTLFILISENSDNILPTILSRTQLFKIPKLTKETIVKQLEEEFKTTDNTFQDIAEIANGNYIKARKLYIDAATSKALLERFSLIMNSALANAKRDWANIQFYELQELINKIKTEEKENQKELIRYMIQMFRNILIAGNQNDELIKVTQEEKKVLSLFVPNITLRNISPIVEACSKAIFYIERNGNTSLIFNDLYFTIVDRLIVK